MDAFSLKTGITTSKQPSRLYAIARSSIQLLQEKILPAFFRLKKFIKLFHVKLLLECYSNILEECKIAPKVPSDI